MNIQTQYNYEKTWTTTQEKDLLRIIEEAVDDAGVDGTLMKYLSSSPSSV